MVGVSGRIIRDWREGLRIPQIGSLLRVCAFLEISPSYFLAQVTSSPCSSQTQSASPKHFVWEPRQIQKIKNEEGMLQLLQATLESLEYPPPSMRQIARRHGIDFRNLQRSFPNECKEISGRFREYLQSRRRERLQQICAEVHRVTVELHTQGKYPSVDLVTEHLSKSGFMWEPAAKEVWRHTLKQLGCSQTPPVTG